MCGTKMVTDGLPLGRWERGADNDILAGADFLSVFIESSLHRAYSETTTAAVATTLLDLETENVQTISDNYIRTPRGTSPFAMTSTEDQFVLDGAGKSDISDASSSVNDGVIVAVRVSSSVGRTVNKKLHQMRDRAIEKSILSDSLTESPTTEILDQNFVASQEHPSIVAKASKSELSVEESEPITRDSDSGSLDITGYPAKVEPLPNPYNPTASFLGDDLTKDSKPFHQTVIYHDNPNEPGRARSVSYSTVIQHPSLLPDIERSPQQYEKNEGSFNSAQALINNFPQSEEKIKLNDTFLPDSMSSVKSSSSSMPPKNWEEADKNHGESTKTVITTERNWETQEKPFSHSPPIPKVYGRSEQNYEIDEAVSVVTNGRAHGLQPSIAPGSAKNSTKDDNQKVGYVVEGRNYRKYRVEERTADGFIVGEYGVVSHDDGSLRGVRYTADGTINPRLIYDALMKFLSL